MGTTTQRLGQQSFAAHSLGEQYGLGLADLPPRFDHITSFLFHLELFKQLQPFGIACNFIV